MSHHSTQLGLGLIGIGKPWGHAPRPVPSDSDAQVLLEYAFELGIRYFDTAPSYGDGVSEARLGRFVKSLGAAERAAITVATKMGEHWDAAKGEPYADHTFDALRRSLDKSIERLGTIDILQLHKTTPAALASEALARAWEYARSLGIERVGPSVSDPDSARAAIRDPAMTVMQMPFNAANEAFGPLLDEAIERGMWVAINRPFAMGALVASGADKRAAFDFVRAHRPAVILTGTVSPEHLRENWEVFSA